MISSRRLSATVIAFLGGMHFWWPKMTGRMYNERAAALAFWLSRLVVARHRDDSDNVRCNNPEEFQRIVQQHAAHFFYLDERQLLD